MRKVRIGFSKPRSKLAVGSLLIRWAERCDFSHALVRWDSPSLERELVYQASHGLVHFVSGPRFDQEAEMVREYEVELNEEAFRTLVQKCVDLAGIRYGYLQLLGMGLERITGLKNPFRDGPKTYVCSELVGELFDAELDLEYVGPKKLEEYVALLPNARRVL